MLASNNKKMVFGSIVASAMGTVMAFQQPVAILTSAASNKAPSQLHMVAVDPSTISKKDYEDICGVSFGNEDMSKRLQRTNFLYPRHVEVIEDIAPVAAAMVDEVVSYPTARVCVFAVYNTIQFAAPAGVKGGLLARG
jgi:hypothetical protein